MRSFCEPYNMGQRLVTPPTEPPISLEDMKHDLRVDHADDDTLIAAYLDAATQWVEERLQKKLMTQTWELVLDEFPRCEIYLPFGPAQTVETINYFGITGTETLLPATLYYLDNASRDPWIFPQVAWPLTLAAANAVSIKFVAGYPTAEEVPNPIKQAVRLLVRESYDGAEVEVTVDRMLVNYLRMVA